MTHDIFISHASADKEIADAMTEALEARDIQCWIAPRDIRPGDTWGGSIVRAIESSKMMVIIFSESSNASRQVLREVERAVQKDVVLLPFRIDEVPPTGDMEYFLSATHWLDALTPDLDRHLRELIRTSNSILKKTTSAADESSRSRGARLKKAEPSIDKNVGAAKPLHPKSLHPNSSATSEKPSNLPSPKAESAELIVNPKDTNHAQQSTELKLEARRTPPGTKAKHSQTVAAKKAQVKEVKPRTSTSKTNKTGDEKRTSSNLIILLVLAALGAAGLFMAQKTDLFNNKEPKPPIVIDPPVVQQSIELVDTSVGTPPTTVKEPSEDLNASLNRPKSLSSDLNTLDIDRSTTEDGVADDVSEGQVLSNEPQVNSSQNSSSNNDNDQPNKLLATPTPEIPRTIPEAISEPGIDEISALATLANSGDLGAILELSERYLNGNGVDRNELESVRLMEIAADSGSSLAQKRMADYYARGKIVPRNDEQALTWYTLAAEQGDMDSQYSLGEIYEFGFGTKANIAEAKKWYQLAADQGHMKAGLFLENFRKKVAAATALAPPPLQAPDPIQKNEAGSESAPETSSELAPEVSPQLAPEISPEPASQL